MLELTNNKLTRNSDTWRKDESLILGVQTTNLILGHGL